MSSLPKDPKQAAKQASLDKCCQSLYEKLSNLRNDRFLFHSLDLDDGRFQLLEFFGDACLYERISFFLMQTRRFLNPHLLTEIRSKIISNQNLAVCFANLKIHHILIPPVTDPEQLLPKVRADVVEAMIGEMSEIAPVTLGDSRDYSRTLVREVLNDLLAYISYTGEQAYFAAAHGQNDSNAAYLDATPGPGSSKFFSTPAHVPSPASTGNPSRGHSKSPPRSPPRSPPHSSSKTSLRSYNGRLTIGTAASERGDPTSATTLLEDSSRVSAGSGVTSPLRDQAKVILGCSPFGGGGALNKSLAATTTSSRPTSPPRKDVQSSRNTSLRPPVSFMQ